MTKYTFVLFLLIACTVAQTCFRCKPQACTINGCTDCQDGFMLSSQGWCALFTPIQGCRVYNASDNSQCVQCNVGRQLINSRCYIKPDNCTISDQFRQCLNCNVDFQLYKGRCYTNQIQNCPLGSLPSYLPGSVPAGARFCQSLRAQNCLRTSDDGNIICLECQPGITLINGRCLRVISNTSCSSNTCSCPNGFIFRQICYIIQIDKCNILRDPVYCMACQQGFVAIDGICLKPVKQDDINCNVKAPDSDYCTGCNQDYILDIDGFCYKNFNLSDADCPVQSGYFSRQNGRCYYNDRRCESVLFTDTNFTCIRCQEGFTLKNKTCQRNICIQQRDDGICQQTFIGYIITGPNQFQKLPTSCLKVDSSNNCLQCSQFTKNLSMISGQENPKVCAYQTANCTQYNNNGSCIKCLNQNQQNGYILRGRLCLKKAQNCLERDKNDLSKCVKCLPGFHLDSIERICYENIAGCEVYLRKSDCKQCEAQAYILYQNKCFSINKQCIDYDSNNLCRRCSNGLMPFKNRCVYYHPFCLQYGVDKVCSLVANGWTLGNGMTESQKNYYTKFMIRGQQVTRRNQAVNLTGVTASSTNQAGAYDQGSLITTFPYANLIHLKISGVNLLGQISSCNQGFTLINQACISNVVPNCELYSIQDICIRCSPQHTLLGNFTCSRGLQCSEPRFIVNGRCQQCARGSILIGAQCFTIGTQALIDQQLQSNLYYKFTYPDGTYFAWPRIANCNNQSNPIACSQCQAPYQNINGLCVIPVDRCVDYGFNFGQSPGICQTCANGFVYWFGQCRQLTCQFNSARICNSCPNNFYYYFGICLINQVNNCLITQNATCVQCNYGYYLNLQNQCQSTVSGCLLTNKDTGRCLQCRSNLVLYTEKCVPQVRYCVDYDSNNVCIRCQRTNIINTKLMSDGTCALLEGQCASVDQKTKVCDQCNLGYSKINQDNRILCVNLRPNCQTYDTRGRCIQCNSRYVLINNQCRIFLQNCLLYTPDELNCTKCTPDTQLDAGCCKRPDPNCINYNQCICTSCMTKFYLNNQGTCVANPAGCNIYDFVGRRCKECATGFYLLTNGLCLIKQNTINGCLPEFSQRYDPINGFRCVRCVKEFQLRDDGLCYAFNCIANNPLTRQCINCPTYYRIYQAPNNPSNSISYCIPYFCNIYIPGKDKCQSEIPKYQGGHIIIPSNRTILTMYCKVLDNITGKCLSCNNFRYPNNNTQFNLCYPLNCLNNLQFNCLNCQFGYELNSLYPGSCLATFCSNWKQDGKCNTCNQPYTLSGVGICQNKGCCQQYDNLRGLCKLAKKYYVLQGSICVPVNCLKYDSQRLTVCSKCAVGYTLFADGTCRVTNCQVQTLLGESCVACRRGFEIKFSTTFLRTICNPRNCTQISDDLNTCLKCQQGFTLDSDKLCRANYCSIFRNDLICSKCIDYFILGPDLRCSADCSIGNVTRCQCCKFDFTINITSGLCQPISSYCTSVNLNTGLCSACATNYLLLSGRCIAPVLNCKTPSMLGCLSCNVGYEVKDNCRCIPKFCKQMGNGGRCAVCHPRFELTSLGLCRPRDCQMFSIQTWACNSCYSRFIFENGVCVSTNCQLWDDFQNTTCKKCLMASSLSNKDFSQSVLISYSLTNGACYIKYCVNDPRQLYCKECLPGFNLTLNGLCQCSNYDANNICICPDGYIYDNSIGQCIVNSDVCLQRNANGTCLQCPFQYQRPSQNKGECIPLYCSRWQNVSIRYIQCRACFPNFDLVNGFCQSSLCLKFQNRSGFLLPQCTSCQEGYSPTSNFCVPNNCQRLTYNLTTGFCAKCNAFGYVLSADGTRCITANCKTLFPSGQCAECLPGYINFTKLCIASNCTLFDDVTCKGCLDGWFQLKNEICYANNCQNYGPNIFCTKCNDGFVLARNYTCLRKNCNNDAKEKCLQCSRGFIYNSDVQRCTPINCQELNAQNDGCDRCRSGYFKQNGTCLDIFCDPSSFANDFNCLKCQEGYSFNANRFCLPVNTDFCAPGKYFNVNLGACISIPTNNCLTFVDNKCMRCADDFILYKNLCYSIKFCLTYSYFVGCLSCVQGFYLDPPQCKQFQQDPNCIQNTTRQCIRCRQGYQLVSGSICQSNDQNCLNFNTNGRCAQCRDGFYPGQRICQQNPVNCIRADPLGKCIQCATNFDIQNGICYKKYANCARYSQKSQFCIQCATNFTLLGIQCICALDSQLILNQLCIKLPANCLQINANTFRCVRCATNYSLSPDFTCINNIAINPPQNCRIYDPLTGICTQCFPNYIISNNTCQICRTGTTKVGNECFVIIIGCFQYLMNGVCKNCAPGYNLQNAKCVIITAPPFCDIYDPKTGICQKCLQNYNLTSSGCVINNCLIPSDDGKICNKCIDIFNWNGRQCQYQTDFCLSYSRGNCQSCENFAILKQNRCVPNFCNIYEFVTGVCNSCLQKYQLISRRCFPIIFGCQDYLPQGLCRNCLPGFRLNSSNICQKQDIPKFCIQYNFTTTVCLQCAPGYALTSDQKLCILNNCQLTDPTGMICNRCRTSFQWNGQLCVYSTDFCLVYGGAFCTNCISWSRLDRNRCVPSNCLSYNYNIGACQNCANGFTLYQKRCFTIIIFCIAYGDNGNCVQCQNSYVLSINGLSCAPATVVVPNCFAQSTQTCLRCRHRYYLYSQMCSQYIPYCNNIDIAGKCISCCFGSTLINSICQRDQTIKNCLNQIGRNCQQCANGFRYCDFCEACLPQTPNCNRYNSAGGCISCVGDFSLAKGICIAPPVGFVTGTTGTCRTGYYQKDGNCYKNTNQLSSYPAIRSLLPSSIPASFFTAKSNSQTTPLVIFSFAIQLDSQSNNASFLLYYRSKALDPLVCWNSCIPTTIDRQNYLRQLIYPIIANQVNIYLIGRNLQNANVDFRILS